MKRNSGIVFLRLLATIGVIGDHVPLCAISQTNVDVSPFEKFVYKTMAMANHWPVPVFMMITGYLLLQKKVLDYKTIWKYFKRIAIVLLLFGFVFSFMEVYFVSHSITLDGLCKAFVNVLEGHTWEHMWYLYVLLGIYLILPVLHKIATLGQKGEMVIVACLVLFFTSLLPSFRGEVGIEFPISSIYVGYVCLGYLTFLFTDRLISNKGNNWLFMIIALLSFIPIAIAQYKEYVCNHKLAIDLTSYTSIVIVIQSLAFFNLVMKNSNKFIKFSDLWLIKRFDRCSFGIYIIHMLWINVAIKLLHIDIIKYNNILLVPVGIAIVFILSWLSTELMLKVPILKKYI